MLWYQKILFYKKIINIILDDENLIKTIIDKVISEIEKSQNIQDDENDNENEEEKIN